MRDLFLTAVILGLLPLAVFRPHVGVLVWTWVSLMSPHRLGWGFSYSFPFVQFIALATLVGIVLSRERKTPPTDSTSVFALLLCAWVTVTTVTALVPEIAYPRLIFVLKIIAMTFITVLVINTRERIHALIWVIVISVGFYGIKGGLFTILTQGNYRVFGPPRSMLADNNQLGLALIMIVPLIRYLQAESAVRAVRLAMAGALATTFFAILGSYSRGALVGLAAMTSILILKSRQRLVLVPVVALSLLLGLTMMPQAWYARMGTLETSIENPDRSVQGRFEIWDFATAVALDRPLVGGGFNVFDMTTAYERYAPDITPRSAHSITFQVLGEHGFVGLFLFYGMLLTAWLKGFEIQRLTRGIPELQWARELSSMLQTSLVGFLAAGQFLNLAFFDLVYVLLGAIVAVWRLVRREVPVLARNRHRFGRLVPSLRGATDGRT